MIVFDTETTGLLKPLSIPLDQQPEIVEVGAVKLHDETLEEVASLSLLLKPRARLSDEVIKIHGITNEALADKSSFVRELPTIINFFLGERTVVAQFCAFDMGMLELELRRIGYVTKFPWPPQQLDTVELTNDLSGKRLHLHELYTMATGQDQPNKHRALDDVRSLATVVRWLRAKDARI